MSIDIQEIQEGAAEAQETVADVATGAIVDIVEKTTHPVSTVRKTARRLERKGDPVNTQIKRQVTRTRHEVEDAVDDVVSGNLAERLALKSIRATRNRSRRLDIVGDVLYVGLSLFHRGVSGTRSRLTKLENASQPPVRNGSAARNVSSNGTAPRARRSTGTRTRARRSSRRRTASA